MVGTVSVTHDQYVDLIEILHFIFRIIQPPIKHRRGNKGGKRCLDPVDNTLTRNQLYYVNKLRGAGCKTENSVEIANKYSACVCELSELLENCLSLDSPRTSGLTTAGRKSVVFWERFMMIALLQH